VGRFRMEDLDVLLRRKKGTVGAAAAGIAVEGCVGASIVGVVYVMREL